MPETVHILHVESDAVAASMLRAAFALRDSHVEHLHQVRTAEEALDFLGRRGAYESAPAVRLVLMAFTLPVMSGLELLEALKADPKTRRIPIVVLTDSSGSDDCARSYALHANSVVRKPDNAVDLAKLLSALDTFWVQLVSLPTAAG